MMAWKRGVKSLYYCRSLSIQRAETVAGDVLAAPIGDQAPSSPRIDVPSPSPRSELGGPMPPAEMSATNYEECLSCQ
jgi:ribonucleoside-diphosphate reductase alpha chain